MVQSKFLHMPHLVAIIWHLQTVASSGSVWQTELKKRLQYRCAANAERNLTKAHCDVKINTIYTRS